MAAAQLASDVNDDDSDRYLFVVSDCNLQR